MLINKIDYKGQSNPEWETIKTVEIIYCDEDSIWHTTTLQESPELIQVNKVEQDGKIKYVGTKWNRMPITTVVKTTSPIHTHIVNSEKYIMQKCDMCEKEYPMNQIEYDPNYGYVCRKCESGTS